MHVGEVEARPGGTVLLPGSLPGARLSGQGALLPPAPASEPADQCAAAIEEAPTGLFLLTVWL